ncbi:ClbS/DfsB family four-helix bundle protein [Fusobacterium sp. PH5-44]|uniref:ClbS/DfsB family four-helix bundle protein n=1 Tax=unclassified Fusobacterium TaxID=2648384 RepID=UPI003D215F6E
MIEYANKKTLVDEIRKTSDSFIKEFIDIHEIDRDTRLSGVDRTPQEMIAYQLGWLNLIRNWDKDELAGKEIHMPAIGYKWNKLGGLYQSFYLKYKEISLEKLVEIFKSDVESFIKWFDNFDEEEIFKPAGRKWAASTPANWPISKWIHINTVAPFKSFRNKIRKWKKLSKEVKSYNKLVRDNIIDIIKNQNQNCSYHIATDEEYKTKLLEKLLEEVQEFIIEKNEEELADIYEVLDHIIDIFQFDNTKINKIKNEKNLINGKFRKKIILEKVNN